MTLNSLSFKLVFLVLVALATRIVVFVQPQIISVDGVLWIKMARLFSVGGYAGVEGSYFNLYPFLIFLVQKFLGDWELSGRLISIAAGTLAVIPVFLLGRSLYGERAGWLSAIFYLALPNFLEYDSQVLRDPLWWFLMALTLWLIWEGFEKNRSVFFALASIPAGLGALTRVEGFVLWCALACYTLVRRKEGVSAGEKAWNFSLLALLFPLLVSLVVFSLRVDSSRKTFAFEEMSSFAYRFIKAHTREILKPRDPIAAIEERTYASLPTISKNSLELASRHRFSLAISEVIYKFVKSSNLLIFLILLGVWRRRNEGFRPSDWFLSVVFGALLVMSVFYVRQTNYFSTRHGLTLVLPSLFFACHGLSVLSDLFNRIFHRVTPKWIIAKKYMPHILTIIFIMALFIQGGDFRGKEKFIQKEVGLWLKEGGYGGSVIMAPKRYSRLAFYADGKFMEMPGSWKEAIDQIQQRGVKVVVVNSFTVDRDCPGFSENWRQAGLIQVNSFTRGKEKSAIHIYKNP